MNFLKNNFRSNYSNKSLDAIKWVVDSTNEELGYRAAKISRRSKRIIGKSSFAVFYDSKNSKVPLTYEKFLHQLDYSPSESFQLPKN